MDFKLTAEQNTLRSVVRDFAEKELRPLAPKWDEEERFPKEVIPKIAELGLFGLTIPKEYGGLGKGPIEAILVIEELSKACANTAVIVFDAILGPLQVIAHFGTEEQKRRFLPRACTGDVLIGISMSEPHAGSASTDLKTRAVLKGDHYVVNGHKAFVEDTSETNTFLVYVRLNEEPGAKGIGAIVVEKGIPGFAIGPRRPKMGLRGSIQADFFFTDCRVPKANLVLGPGEFGKLMTAFNLERCGNATMALGIAQAALDHAVSYSKTRQQFGRDICEFQGIQWMLADMATKVEAARLLIYKAVSNAAEGFPSIIEASMAKLFANEMAIEVTNKALQIHGGNGYSREFPLERMVRDARAWAIAGGTTEIQRNLIAGQLLGRRFSQRKA